MLDVPNLRCFGTGFAAFFSTMQRSSASIASEARSARHGKQSKVKKNTRDRLYCTSTSIYSFIFLLFYCIPCSYFPGLLPSLSFSSSALFFSVLVHLFFGSKEAEHVSQRCTAPSQVSAAQHGICLAYNTARYSVAECDTML